MCPFGLRFRLNKCGPIPPPKDQGNEGSQKSANGRDIRELLMPGKLNPPFFA